MVSLNSSAVTGKVNKFAHSAAPSYIVAFGVFPVAVAAIAWFTISKTMR